jgi:hypothetical protein
MGYRLETSAQAKHYALRKQTPAPAFRIIKSMTGFRQLRLRSLEEARSERSLVKISRNLKRMSAV